MSLVLYPILKALFTDAQQVASRAFYFPNVGCWCVVRVQGITLSLGAEGIVHRRAQAPFSPPQLHQQTPLHGIGEPHYLTAVSTFPIYHKDVLLASHPPREYSTFKILARSFPCRYPHPSPSTPSAPAGWPFRSSVPHTFRFMQPHL